MFNVYVRLVVPGCVVLFVVVCGGSGWVVADCCFCALVVGGWWLLLFVGCLNSVGWVCLGVMMLLIVLFY